MRVAVFSDIHGNMSTWTAFKSMVATLDVSGYIFCGDIPGYGRGHGEIMEDMAAMPNMHWVLGNNDHSCLGSLCREVPALAGKLRALPSFLSITLEGVNIDIMHGSPESRLYGQIYPEDLDTYIYDGNADIVLTGHTHRRMCKSSNGVLFLNPGSLGYPRDNNLPGFALLDLPEKKVTFVDLRP